MTRRTVNAVHGRVTSPVILVVDDEAMLRRAIRTLVERSFGATVFVATSNDEAMRVLLDQNADLVVTDLVHPGSGIELIRAIRKHPRLRRIPILVQSAALQSYGLEARQAGARAFLDKPYDVEDLTKAISRFVGPLRLPEPDVALIELGTEMQTHDYKGSLTLETERERASFAKDVIAMANLGGGTIVVGVQETSPGEFTPAGLSDGELSALETTRLFQSVNSFMDPPVAIVSRRVHHNGRTFVFIEVPSGGTELIMATRDHQDAGLFKSRIYSRTAGAQSAALSDSAEIRFLIDRLVEARLGVRKRH